MGDRQGKLFQGMGVMEAALIPVEGGIGDLTTEPELVSEGPTWAVYRGIDFAMSVPPFDAACPAGEQLPLVVSTKLCEGYDADITESLLKDGKLKSELLVDPETGELTDDVRPHAKLIEGYGRVSDCNAPWIFSNPRLYSLNIWT